MATKKAKPEKVIEVEWEDITSYSGWNSISGNESAPVLKMKTIGYLMSENKKVIRIAQSLSYQNNNLGELIVIPKVVILSRKKIR